MSSPVFNTTRILSTHFDLHSLKTSNIDDISDQFISAWISSTTIYSVTERRSTIDSSPSNPQYPTQSSKSNNTIRYNNDLQDANITRYGRKVRPPECFLQEIQLWRSLVYSLFRIRSK